MKIPKFFIRFYMKPGMGKGFNQCHDHDFKPFTSIEQLKKYYLDAIKLEESYLCFYERIEMHVNGDIVAFRVFL